MNNFIYLLNMKLRDIIFNELKNIEIESSIFGSSYLEEKERLLKGFESLICDECYKGKLTFSEENHSLCCSHCQFCIN